MPDGESGILGRDSTTTFMEQGSNSFHAPNVIYEPSIQIGRDLQGFVNPAKVIVCKVNGKCCTHIFDLAGERIGQPSETTHLHADREVLALHVRSGNVRRLRVPGDWDWDRIDDIRRAVPLLAISHHGL